MDGNKLIQPKEQNNSPTSPGNATENEVQPY
jgi:hypothetical protein